MKRITTPMALVLTLFSCIAINAQADLFGDLKKKLKKETKKEAVNTVNKNLKKGNSVNKKTKPRRPSKTVKLGSGPDSGLVQMTNCADIKPNNIITGYVENYTFQQGFKKEKRSGFIKRKNGQLQQGCILPSLQPNQSVYMEVDSKAYEAMGNSNDWEMQCVRSDNPGAGALTEKESRSEAPYHVKVLSGKDLLLFCGNSEGIDECSKGSNSKRSGEWKKKLSARGKTMLSLSAHTSTLAPASGEKVYCQYYNKNEKVSLFAFEYLRVRK